MLNHINGRPKGSTNFEYHVMGAGLDDTILVTTGKTRQALVKELIESGFTGRQGTTAHKKTGTIQATVDRLECGTK